MQHSPYIKFHCYTDDAEDLNDVFNVYKLSGRGQRKTHSLEHDEVFDPEFIGAEKTDHTIYMDIDMDWNVRPTH